MIYKNFKGKKLSALGLGCMRFPTLDKDNSKVDVNAVDKMVEYALENGINYFDTAWAYHSGNSESVIGGILKKYSRDSFFLATKFPGHDIGNMGKVEEIFEKQLERCGVDYFDFYLFHNVNEGNIDAYLDPRYKTLEYLTKQKQNGRIKHLGFSTHGSVDTMKRFLDAYGCHMEFCQIQLNWLDWKLQNAKEKVALLKEYNLPIWVMEPVRGGKLANVEPEYREKLSEIRPQTTPAELSFRFLQSVSGVTVTLSGMSNLEQLKENIDTYREEKPLNEAEMKAVLKIADEMTSKKTLPCTSCRYCTEHCPTEIDIPKIIEIYNEYSYTGGGFLAPMMIRALPEEKRPSACISCRACEAVCPQNIKISEMMRDFSEKLKK